jgi:transcriptional regulator with PAS, ATPase and Fis domain
MTDRFARLLDLKGFGAILFDERFTVMRMNPAAEAMLGLSGAFRSHGSILDLFPELVGVEVQIAAIVAGQDTDYRLEHVNRESGPGQVRYLNLWLLPDPAPGRALLVIEDVSEQALARQSASQQRYELFLYQRDADFRRQQAGGRILGNAPAIRRVRDTIQKLSRIPSATVLLTGETGCGKNLAARVIHASSMPAGAPFVEINCAALPEHLIESELFGYEKGAFTHAVCAKPGLLEEAHEGSLFLDEIGEMSANMQAKLLAVLESRCFRRLGSTRSIAVNIRVIASTNRDLQADVAAKRFREDLFFRLNVVSLPLPPLRELGEDILVIAEHLVKVYNIEFKKRVKGFTAEARRSLLGHRWPGNVRELGNCIERAMIFADKEYLDATDLVLAASAAPPIAAGDDRWKVPAGGIDLEDVERRLIQSALQQCGQNKTQAARLLGLSRDTLRYRLDKYRDRLPRTRLPGR